MRFREGLERSESNGDERRENITKRAAALNQLKRASQMSRGSNLPRPASSIMLRSQQRPKSGGRPYTASERRRAMFAGGSLAKSMEIYVKDVRWVRLRNYFWS